MESKDRLLLFYIGRLGKFYLKGGIVEKFGRNEVESYIDMLGKNILSRGNSKYRNFVRKL